MLTCKATGYQVHEDDMEANSNMKQSKIGNEKEFNSPHAQMMSLDPLAVPIMTIMRPQKIAKLTM